MKGGTGSDLNERVRRAERKRKFLSLTCINGDDMNLLKKAITGITLLAFTAGAAGAADYAKAKAEEKARENTVIVETSIPKANNSSLEAILSKSIPVNYAGKKLDWKTGNWIEDEEANTVNHWKEAGEDSQKGKDAKEGFNPFSINNLLWEVPVVAAIGTAIYFLTKKKTPTPPIITPGTEYYVNLELLDMTSLNGNSFVSKKTVDDGRIIYNGTTLDAGVRTFTHKIPAGSTDYTIKLNYTGSVLDNVLCIRKSGEKSNLVQTLGTDATVELKSVADASHNVNLELYKIPNWVNIDWVKEALVQGTAVYNHDITVYIVNDEYSASEWPAAKQSSIPYINKVLPQIAEATGARAIVLDENATAGDLKVRLGKSLQYVNPSAGIIANSGIISNSDIKISAIPLEAHYYLEEAYHAMGIRDDIRPGSLADYISDKTDTLNRFGKALMRINYFLNPNTQLGTASAAAKATASRANNNRTGNNPADFFRNESRDAYLNLRERLGDKGNVGVSLAGSGNRKSILVNGNYMLGTGDLFFEAGNVVRAGFSQNVLGQAVRVVYDGSTNRVQFAGGFRPMQNTLVNLAVDNLLRPQNILLNARYDSQNLGAMISVDNIMQPRNISIGANVSVESLGAFLNYTYNAFGASATRFGITAQIGNEVQIIANGTQYNKQASFDIGVLAKTFSLLYGKDALGKDKVSISVSVPIIFH
jgi:hypothetical protein